jgi:phage pi2 protein 07
MKDKEKQIEEMEYDISYIDSNGYYYDEDGYKQDAYADTQKIAESLVDKGWVKLPKDRVVLSKEEFEKLKGRAEEVFNEMTERMKAEVKIAKKMGIVKGSKETAEKIYYGIAWRYYDKEMLDILREYLAKEFNVEIKE